MRELVEKFIAVRTKRRELDEQSNNLKLQENELKSQLLEKMQSLQQSSVSYDDLGKVIRTTKRHYEIRDKDLFARAILQSIVEAVQAGGTFYDGLLVQLRPSKDAVDFYLESHPNDTIGLENVETYDITIRS